MNKPLSENIKNVLFRYISIVFNISESSKIMFGIQLLNADDYYYEITSGLEKIAREKKMKFYTIDLDFEDFGMSEIDENGKYILPPWLKNDDHAVILVYNLDGLNKKNYKLKQLKEIFLNDTIEGVKIPPQKHFVIISNKNLQLKHKIMELDIKKAVEIEKKQNKEEQ